MIKADVTLFLDIYFIFSDSVKGRKENEKS